MKKKVMIAAAIAVMAGVGAYFGNASNSPSSDGLSDLLLENAEALAIELPEVTITCNSGHVGSCYTPDYRYPTYAKYPCRYTGLQTDYCPEL
jgi:hypothetical protein